MNLLMFFRDDNFFPRFCSLSTLSLGTPSSVIMISISDKVRHLRSDSICHFDESASSTVVLLCFANHLLVGTSVSVCSYVPTGIRKERHEIKDISALML